MNGIITWRPVTVCSLLACCIVACESHEEDNNGAHLLAHTDSLRSIPHDSGKGRNGMDSITCCNIGLTFAKGLLGTGCDHFLTSYTRLSADMAIVITGTSEQTDVDSLSYRIYLGKRNDAWRIISYEYVMEPTGQRMFERLTIPFPDPYWDSVMKNSG